MVERTRKEGGTTMGDVRYLMADLYHHGLMEKEDFRKLLKDYDEWAHLYRVNFPGRVFEDCML
jgi:hypothetical protein